VSQQPRLAVCIAKRKVLYVDPCGRAFASVHADPLRGNSCADLELGCRQHHIGEALRVQAQHPQCNPFVNQCRAADHELVFVGEIRNQHSNGEQIVHRKKRAERYDDDAFDSEQQLVGTRESECDAAQAVFEIGCIHHQVGVHRASKGLGARQLYTLYAADGFEQMGLLPGRRHQMAFGRCAKVPVQPGAQSQVACYSKCAHGSQLQTVGDHYQQGDHSHHAVDHSLHETGGERALDCLH
jgi:hypothetical protein